MQQVRNKIFALNSALLKTHLAELQVRAGGRHGTTLAARSRTHGQRSAALDVAMTHASDWPSPSLSRRWETTMSSAFCARLTARRTHAA